MPFPQNTFTGAIFAAQIEDAIAEDFRRREAEAAKARRYDILSVATPTQFGNIWDRMVKGENFDTLVDELGKVQAEWTAREKARKESAA